MKCILCKALLASLLMMGLSPASADQVYKHSIQLKWLRGGDTLAEKVIWIDSRPVHLILHSTKPTDPVCENAVLHVTFFPVLRKKNTPPYIAVSTEYRSSTMKQGEFEKMCFVQGDGVTARYTIDTREGSMTVDDPIGTKLTWAVTDTKK